MSWIPRGRRIVKVKKGDILQFPISMKEGNGIVPMPRSDPYHPSYGRKVKVIVTKVHRWWVEVSLLNCKEHWNKLRSLSLGDLVMLGYEPEDIYGRK